MPDYTTEMNHICEPLPGIRLLQKGLKELKRDQLMGEDSPFPWNHEILFAKRDGKRVGFCTYKPNASIKTLDIYHVYVLPECRGLGMFRMMLKELDEIAKSWGFSHTVWEVMRHNRGMISASLKLSSDQTLTFHRHVDNPPKT